MTAADAWSLFRRTGAPEFYLLYREAAAEAAVQSA